MDDYTQNRLDECQTKHEQMMVLAMIRLEEKENEKGDNDD